ncbi:hypothetical protein K456DRAFT_1081969 [Colletotrichum gloeosporioides 23]|nr:hypothetical protein K456DRAFT_1081969 [Colletotrichum gloeosporioides 23]
MKTSIHILAIISAAVPIVAQASSNVLSDTTVLRTITSSPVSPQTGCPTATETLEICSTCMVLQCITISTLTHGCGCPTPVPTEYISFPCKGTCGRIGCSTSYTFISGEVACDGTQSGSAAPGTTTSTIGPGTVTTTAEATGETGQSTGSGSQASGSAISPTAAPNAAGRLAVPFRFW